MAKYKSHKAALLGTIRELEKRGFLASNWVSYYAELPSDRDWIEKMTPDECEKFILDVIDDIIAVSCSKDDKIADLKNKLEKYESLKDTKAPERPKFVSPSQTHKTFWSKLKYILFE